MEKMPHWADIVLIPLISLLLAAVLSALVIIGIGEDPIAAFKLMVSMEVTSVSDLLQYCGGVLMLAFSSWLISRSGNQHS